MIVAAVRRHGAFNSIQDLWRASGVRVATMRKLASADAFGSMGLDRQAALWEVRALSDERLPLFEERHEGTEAPATAGRLRHEGVDGLPEIAEHRKVVQDYAAVGLSLKAHPVSFLRQELEKLGAVTAAQLRDQAVWPHGAGVAVGGLVLVRQRPGTASGIVFMTLEDESGTANLIVRPHVYQRYRKAARHGVIILARGTVERQGDVIHVMVRSLEDAGWIAGALAARSRDFH